METTEHKKLYRSREDSVIGGVAGGMAKYFNVDPLVVRIIFIVIALVSQIAPAIVAYLIAMIIIPKEGDRNKDTGEKISDAAHEFEEKVKSAAESIKNHHERRTRGRNIFGFLLIFIGLLFLINQLFPAYHIGFVYVWPWIFILGGLYLIFRRKK